MDMKMLPLVVVPLVVWAGMFFYMLAIDRKLARLEAQRVRQDDL